MRPFGRPRLRTMVVATGCRAMTELLQEGCGVGMQGSCNKGDTCGVDNRRPVTFPWCSMPDCSSPPHSADTRGNNDDNPSSRLLPARIAGAGLLALALAACGGGAPPEASLPDAPADAGAGATLEPVRVREVFATAMTPEDNIDSVASWTGPDGQVLVLATAKSTHRLVVYDGFSGELVRHVGGPGAGAGQFERPNGIAVAGDLAFVVERDNRRVQVLGLPDMETVAMFGDDVLE